MAMAPDFHRSAEITSSPQQIMRRSSQNFAIPSNITDALPECAQSCLAGNVTQQYSNRCTDPLSVKCLCTQYSSQGFTLGELAFMCLETDCKTADHQEQLTAYYSLCAAQPSAVSPTHSSLTIFKTSSALPHSSTTTSAMHITSAPSSSYQSSVLPTSVSQSTATAEPASTTSSCGGASATLACSSASASESTGPTSSLTPAEAIGASVAAFGGLILILGLSYLSIWLRRRKKDRAMLSGQDDRERSSFSSERPEPKPAIDFGKRLPSVGPYVGSPPTQPEPVHFLQISDSKESLAMASVRSNAAHDQAMQNRQLKSSAALGIGQAAMSSQRLHPDMHKPLNLGHPRETLPMNQHMQLHNQSQESLRRLSQLLPEKPIPPVAQPSLRSKRAAGPDALLVPMQNSKISVPVVRTPATIFEEQKSPVRDEAMLQPRMAPPPPNTQLIGGLDPGRADTPTLGQQQMQERNKQPNLSLQIPSKSSRTVLPSSNPRNMTSTKGPAIMDRGYHNINLEEAPEDILSYYKGPQKQVNATRETSSLLSAPRSMPTAITVTRPPRQPKLASSRKNSSGRRNVRNSCGSETSFESADPDEPTPPDDADKSLSLSPVEEQHSPISGLRYPKIPRSANQLVPRSPPLRPDSSIAYGSGFPVTPQRPNVVDSSLSGSTLAARRHGDSVARDLERMLNPPPMKLASPYLSPGRVQRTPHTTQQPPRHESPLKGYGPGGRHKGNTGATTMSPRYPEKWIMDQSPPYETRLIMDKRRGDDLYFSVSSLPSEL